MAAIGVPNPPLWGALAAVMNYVPYLGPAVVTGTLWGGALAFLIDLVIRAVLVTHLHGNAPQVSVESGRKMVPSEHMPTFQELEEAVQAVQM